MSTKILLADDSITIQKVIGIIFGSEEYSLTIVDNGKSALEKALEVSPDILLIDALMPGISGYEVCERVRATPELASKPILLLTGSFEPFDETKAKKCGADDFIAKPFESQQIIAKVTELCERSAFRASEAEILEEKATIMEPQIFEPPVTPVEMIPESAALPDNVWDAFTPSEPPVEEAVQPAVEQSQISFETQPSEPLESPWVPIDEKSFEFEEESAADITQVAFSEPTLAEEVSFDVSQFEPLSEPPTPPAEQTAFPDEAPVVPPQPLEAEAAPSAVTLSEEQLKTVISTLSRDVIERIVWEVVPDLAETMIKEAIRRITEAKQ